MFHKSVSPDIRASPRTVNFQRRALPAGLVPAFSTLKRGHLNDQTSPSGRNGSKAHCANCHHKSGACVEPVIEIGWDWCLCAVIVWWSNFAKTGTDGKWPSLQVMSSPHITVWVCRPWRFSRCSLPRLYSISLSLPRRSDGCLNMFEPYWSLM